MAPKWNPMGSRRWVLLVWAALAIVFIVTTTHRSTSSSSSPSSTSLLGSFSPSTTTTTPPATGSDVKDEPGQARIPRLIWQIFFPPPGGDQRDQLRNMPHWASMAPDYTYTLLGADGGDRFVAQHYPPAVQATYRQLRNPGLKSDLLRYLLLAHHGGTYSDLDTKPVVALEDWIPPDQRPLVGLIVAPEHDAGLNAYGTWPLPLQFCQWTIAASPNHPALHAMIDRALAGLRDLAAAQNATTLGEIRPSDRQVWNATGPPAWSEVVLDSIRAAAPDQVRSWEDLSRLAEPRLFGDILVRPMDSFMTLSDEMRTFPGAGDHQLVHHDFAGAWKEPEE